MYGAYWVAPVRPHLVASTSSTSQAGLPGRTGMAAMDASLLKAGRSLRGDWGGGGNEAVMAAPRGAGHDKGTCVRSVCMECEHGTPTCAWKCEPQLSPATSTSEDAAEPDSSLLCHTGGSLRLSATQDMEPICLML